jgi:hypothetical protein
MHRESSFKTVGSAARALRSLRRVLVVSKRTRYELASSRFGGVGGSELEKLMRARGFPFDRIASAHHAHQDALDTIVRSLRRRDVDVSVVRAPSLIASDLDNVDCVLTAGGDGTVLETAARVKSSSVPVVTINTDPTLSHGYLCAFRLRSGQSFEQGVLDKLRLGLFRPLLRSRIQVRFASRQEVSPLLALNEVFYAERDASRPTVHEVRLPSVCPEGVVQRSSGVIVATGTGSTAWMSSANIVHRQDVARVARAVQALIGRGAATPGAGAGAGAGAGGDQLLSDRDLDAVTQKVNDETLFSPTSDKVQYCMRELVLNGWQGDHDKPLTKHPKHGIESLVSIRSMAWDGVLTFDGIESENVNYGERIEISIAPPAKSFFTVELL